MGRIDSTAYSVEKSVSSRNASGDDVGEADLPDARDQPARRRRREKSHSSDARRAMISFLSSSVSWWKTAL